MLGEKVKGLSKTIIETDNSMVITRGKVGGRDRESKVGINGDETLD